MNIIETKIPDVKIIKPEVFEDKRGYFFESFNQKKFEQSIGRTVTFVQDNQSLSYKNVLRGLHYQIQPHEQGKLVRVIQGKVYDVAVDIRHDSLTYGKWIGEILSAENKKQLWILEGFAHGFLTLSKIAVLAYKVTNYYASFYEKTIYWNDKSLNIQWPLVCSPYISHKDKIQAKNL